MAHVLRLITVGMLTAVSCVGMGGAAVYAPIKVDDASFLPGGDTRQTVITVPGQTTWLHKVAFQRAIEFRGSYVCPGGQGLTALVLLVAGDHAIFHFGAHPGNPGVPSGSFSMQGRVDLAAGIMHLTPLRWVVQPDGWIMAGLDGVSDDGGRTFHGKVTIRQCSHFTVSRVH